MTERPSGNAPLDDWLVIEWTALANDLANQADRLEQIVDSLRQRAAYARDKAKEAERGK
jgi:hypothetical protein